MLLVGAYPASQDDNETFDLLSSILKHSITKFVCLQEEYRTHGVTESMWRNGQALRPYFLDVQALVANRDRIPEFDGYDIVHPSNLSFVHVPIRDCSVTDDGRVLELARTLVTAISQGERIYLHCWGGHGRTGTLVCIMLHLMYGLNPVDSMARCQMVHDLRQCPVVVGSPQTQTQRDQVTRVIKRLMAHPNFYKRTISDLTNMTGTGNNSNDNCGINRGGGVAKDAVDQQRSPRSSEAAALMHSQAHSAHHTTTGLLSPPGGPSSTAPTPVKASSPSSPSSPSLDASSSPSSHCSATPHTPSATWASVVSKTDGSSTHATPASPYTYTPQFAGSGVQYSGAAVEDGGGGGRGGRERTAMSIDAGDITHPACLQDQDQDGSIAYMIEGDLIDAANHHSDECEGEATEGITSIRGAEAVHFPLKPTDAKPSDSGFGFRIRWGSTATVGH